MKLVALTCICEICQTKRTKLHLHVAFRQNTDTLSDTEIAAALHRNGLLGVAP